MTQVPTFNELDADARIAVAKAALLERRTIKERWLALSEEEESHWDVRAAKAASLLITCGSIVDFGCGTMQLERHLPASVRYVPVDIVKRDDRTIVLDLNEVTPPSLAADAAAVLGVLEYLFDVPRFLRALATEYSRAVISYNVTDGDGGRNRLRSGWFNNYSRSQIEDIFRSAGYRINSSDHIGEQQLLWDLMRILGRGGRPRRPGEIPDKERLLANGSPHGQGSSEPAHNGGRDDPEIGFTAARYTPGSPYGCAWHGIS